MCVCVRFLCRTIVERDVDEKRQRFPVERTTASGIKLNYTHNPVRLVTAVINGDFNCDCGIGRNNEKTGKDGLTFIFDIFGYPLDKCEQV